VVISLERGADLHMAQLSPGKRAVKWVCVTCLLSYNRIVDATD